ncbi:MAG: LysR family transcriptional regulator [Kordiimonadaceae bacterium]|nr:LysR family transcriptional regulator [Kordiimonadaceae bacterium]
MKSIDWTYLQSFVAVAENGSLANAANAAGGSAPTMSRHISTLEADLEILLFERTGGGLKLTSAGLDLLDHARDMAIAANKLSLAAAGRTETVEGIVRITASQIMATYVLPGMLKQLKDTEPQITIELVSTDKTENLLMREADIALRMYRPEQSDVISRKIVETSTGIFAAKDYIAANGMPSVLADLLHHSVIGYDRGTQILDGFAAAGHPVDRSFFSFLCDDQTVCWEMVRAGHGIGFNQKNIGRADSGLVELISDIALPKLPIWLTAHAELKTSKRVRRVYDFLADKIQAYYQ